MFRSFALFYARLISYNEEIHQSDYEKVIDLLPTYTQEDMFLVLTLYQTGIERCIATGCNTLMEKQLKLKEEKA